jgi:D-sedoheptulose 7-phosphate isomerase
MKYVDELIKKYPELEDQADMIKIVIMSLSIMHNAKASLFICGNGGSAADADHISAELTKSFLISRKDKNKNEPGIRAMSLTPNCAEITAYGNDVGFDKIFSQKLSVFAEEKDILLCISTSGNSINILNAAILAKNKNMLVFGLLGNNKGKIEDYCNCIIRAPETETYKIQNYHVAIYHAICAQIEYEIFGG